MPARFKVRLCRAESRARGSSCSCRGWWVLTPEGVHVAYKMSLPEAHDEATRLANARPVTIPGGAS